MYCKLDWRNKLIDFYNSEGKFIESLTFEEAQDLVREILCKLNSPEEKWLEVARRVAKEDGLIKD